MFGLFNRGELDPVTENELENANARLKGLWLQEHTDSGSHAEVNASGDVNAEGSITSGGDGTFDGNVTAVAATTPVTIGALVSAIAYDLIGWATKRSTTDWWAVGSDIGAFSAAALLLQDVANRNATPAGVIGIERMSAINGLPAEYNVGPSPTAVGLQTYLGRNTTNYRWHEINGKTIRASTGFYEGATRTTALGSWDSVTFNAANFTANGAGTWTLTSPDQVTYQYTLVGTTMFVALTLLNTTVAGGPTILTVPIPGSFAAGHSTLNACFLRDNGVNTTGVIAVSSTGNFINISRTDGAPFAAAANTTEVHAQIHFKIQ